MSPEDKDWLACELKKQNGTRKLVVGFLVALATAAIGTGAGMLISQGSRLAVVEVQAAPVSRVAVVETKIEALGKDQETIKRDVKASNAKLDQQGGKMDALLRRFNVRAPPPSSP